MGTGLWLSRFRLSFSCLKCALVGPMSPLPHPQLLFSPGACSPLVTTAGHAAGHHPWSPWCLGLLTRPGPVNILACMFVQRSQSERPSMVQYARRVGWSHSSLWPAVSKAHSSCEAAPIQVSKGKHGKRGTLQHPPFKKSRAKIYALWKLVGGLSLCPNISPAWRMLCTSRSASITHIGLCSIFAPPPATMLEGAGRKVSSGV